MIKKGIILAGGTGSRMSPLTKAVNKQLLPIYDKPLIYYPLSVLMLSGIRNVLIIVNKGQINQFKKILPNGENLGIKISYAEQKYPKGLPDAFQIGKNFIGNDGVVLILGDNFFYGQSLTKILKGCLKINSGAAVILHPVKNPSLYGVAKINKKNKVLKIIEKPKKTKSNLAITGLYLFDKNVVNFAKSINKSNRNETEIVDLINIYNKKNKLKVVDLGRGSTWLDTGTIDSLLAASNYVEVIEERQKYKIACLEEIAFINGWINKKNIINRINFYGNCAYSKYLKKLFV